MAEKRVFNRPTAVDSPSLYAALSSEFSRTFTLHTLPGQVEIYSADFNGVNLTNVQAVIDSAPTPTVANQLRERTRFERDPLLRPIVIWVAQKHGLTEQDAWSEIQVIRQSL